jgi:hypothetical protein
MATSDLLASLPQGRYTFNARIVFEARHPTTGAPVAGVIVSHAAIYGEKAFAPASSADVSPVAPLLTLDPSGAD